MPMNYSDKNDDFSQQKPMLDEAAFWSIIDNSLNHSFNMNDQEAWLVSRVEKMPVEEIVGFRLRTDKLLVDTYVSEMWCAAYIMNDGCSDDGFEYFRCWIISRGKNVYYKAKSDPDCLVNQLSSNNLFEFEGFLNVALIAFENSEVDFSNLTLEDFHNIEVNYPEIIFNWSENDPDNMRRICPTLFDKFL